MTIANTVGKYFYQDQQGKIYAQLDAIENKEQAQLIAKQCISDARLERCKALGTIALFGGVGILIAGVAVLAAKISALAIGIFVFPLAIIPPLYGLVTTLGSLAVGGTVGFYSIKKFAKVYFNQAKEHWANSNHLYGQALVVRLVMNSLPKAETK